MAKQTWTAWPDNLSSSPSWILHPEDQGEDCDASVILFGWLAGIKAPNVYDAVKADKIDLT